MIHYEILAKSRKHNQLVTTLPNLHISFGDEAFLFFVTDRKKVLCTDSQVIRRFFGHFRSIKIT